MSKSDNSRRANSADRDSSPLVTEQPEPSASYLTDWTAEDVLKRVLAIGNDYLLGPHTRLGAIHALTQVYLDYKNSQDVTPLCNHERLLPRYPCSACSGRDPQKAKFG